MLDSLNWYIKSQKDVKVEVKIRSKVGMMGKRVIDIWFELDSSQYW